MKTESRLLESTRAYRKSPKGVLTNMYCHMRARHDVLFSLSEFHERFLNDPKFKRLHRAWVKGGYNIQLKPSLDRIDNKKPYTVQNTTMMTWAENRFKQAATDGKRGRKPAVLQMVGDKIVRRFSSQRQAVKELGISQGDLSMVLNGKRNFVNGYKFIYETPELLKEGE